MNDDMNKVVEQKTKPVTPKAGAIRPCLPPPGFLIGNIMYVPLLPALPILPAFFL